MTTPGRRPSGFSILVAASCAAALACLPAPAAAAPDEADAAGPGESACLWHTRVNFHYRDESPLGYHDTRVSLSLETPLWCAGTGPATVLRETGRAQTARGFADASGSISMSSDQGALRDTYDKHVRWPATGTDLTPAAPPPIPSQVGEGYGVAVNIIGTLRGVEHYHQAGPASPTIDEAQARSSRGVFTQLSPDGDTDRLDLDLYLDPSPAPAAGTSDSAVQIARAALAQPEGEAMLALSGRLLGARTLYTSDGSFSVCYQRTLRSGVATVDVDYCGWLTRGASQWTPARLPPQMPPPATR